MRLQSTDDAKPATRRIAVGGSVNGSIVGLDGGGDEAGEPEKSDASEENGDEQAHIGAFALIG